MPRKRALPSKVEAEALADLDAGRTLAAVAADLKACGYPISEMSLSRLRAAAAATGRPLVARLAARSWKTPQPTPPAPHEGAGATALEEVRRLLGESRQQIDEARDAGDYQTQQRATRNSAALASVLARLEKVEASDSDVIKISRADAADVGDRMRTRVAALLARGPIRCSVCARALSAELAGIPLSDEAPPLDVL